MNTAKLKAAAERANAAMNDYVGGVIDAAEFQRLAAEFHSLTDSPDQILMLISALEAKDAKIAELERSELQLIAERDNAEEALADMYQAATGEAPEWSNWFGFSDAVEAVKERVAKLESGINLETGGDA